MAGGERIKAWDVGDVETGTHRAEVFLIRGEPRGELDLYRGDTLVQTRSIGVTEIALFASGRKDLLSVYMSAIVENPTDAQIAVLMNSFFTTPDDTVH